MFARKKNKLFKSLKTFTKFSYHYENQINRLLPVIENIFGLLVLHPTVCSLFEKPRIDKDEKKQKIPYC